MSARLLTAFYFALGISSLVMLPSLPAAGTLALITCAAAILTAKRASRPLGFFVWGLTWAVLHAGAVLDRPVPEALLDRVSVVTITVDSVVRRSDDRIVFDALLIDSSGTDQKGLQDKKIRLTWYGTDLAPGRGERWRVRVKLKRPRGYRNASTFDYEKALFLERITAKGYVLGGQRIDEGTADAGFATFLSILEARAERMHHAGIVWALSVGDRSRITEGQWSVLRRTGLSHLVAISGLHIGLAAFWLSIPAVLFLRLFPALTVYMPRMLVAAIVGCTLGYFYAQLAGFPVSALRAFAMLSVFGASVAAFRRTRLESVLASAVFLIGLVDPLTVPTPGFWLSITAVWLIGKVVGIQGKGAPTTSISSPTVLKAWSRRLWHAGKRLFQIQVFLFVGLLPVLAFFGFVVSFAGLITNLIVVPIFSLIVVPLLLIGLFAAPIIGSFGTERILDIVDRVLALVMDVGTSIAAFPFSAVDPWPPLAGFCILVAALVGVWAKQDKRLVTLLLILGAFSLGKSWPESRPLEPGEFSLTAFDVGQGLAILITTASHRVLYDSGPQFGQFAPALMPLRRQLGAFRSQGVDVLIASHGASDHFGAGEFIRTEFRPDRFFSGQPEKTGGELCARDIGWVFDQVSFRFIQSEPGPSTSSNDRSCVLLITGASGSALLTGDIESRSEYRLTRHSGERIDVDVLQVPHHGSRSSSTEPFLKAVSPQWALLSRGADNRFGHPHPKVVARYRAHGITVLDTAIQGQIDMISRETGWTIETFLARSKRFYHWAR